MVLFEKVSKMAEDSRIFNDLSLPRKRLKLNDSSPSSCLFNSSEIGDFHSKENLIIDSLDMKKFDILSSPPLSPSPTSAFQDHSNGFGINLGLTLNCDSDLTNGGDSGFNELTMSDSINGVDLGGTGTDTANAKNDNKIGNEDTDSSSSSSSDDSDLISDISDLSGFSDLSDSEKSPRSYSDHNCWIQKQMTSGMQPRTILEYLVPPGHKILIPNHVDDWTLWEIVYSVINEPPRREKLKDLNVFEDALRLLSTCKKIIVLTGAGVSVSCGIPDFRSRDGIYARLAKDFPDLPDPQSMFDIQYFRKDPRPFYKFAKEVFPGSFEPSTCHKFIKLLEERKQLLRNYTQNIDTLEKVAGISNVVECHGSFATASCLNCSYKVDSAAIKEDVFNQTIPYCTKCVVANKEQAVLKPDIVFFGEGLPETFHSMIEVDKEECDLLIVIGSSLKVRPVALIPNSLPPSVPQILINRETLPQCTFDIELLGDCDIIINEICHRLGAGFNHLCYNDVRLTETCYLNTKNENISHPSEEATNSTNSRGINLNSSNLSPECIEIYNAAKNDGDSKVLNNEIKVGEITESHSKERANSCKKVAKSGVVSRFPENTYLFCPPSRYIFSGAEIFGSELDSDATENKENASLRNLSDLELELEENCLPVTSDVGDISKSTDSKIENTKNVVEVEAKNIQECK